MFSKKDTIREIMDFEGIKKYVTVFFPEIEGGFVPDSYLDEPLEVVEKDIMMPWGVPFPADSFIESAARVLDMMHGNSGYEFIPLWTETPSQGFMPEIAKKNEEIVCLLTTKGNRDGKKPTVIICPGGGYEFVSMDNEGIQMAEYMEKAGYKAFILNYRVVPNNYPKPQMDLALAVKYVKANAETYGADPENVLLIGSSAGGHLCASTMLYAEEVEQSLMKELEKGYPKLTEKYRGISVKADKLCLNYPVISFMEEAHEPSFQALTGGDEKLRDKLSVERHLDGTYPKTFVWACEDDELVPVSNARRMGEALKHAGVPCEMKIYPTGGHGCGLADGTSAEGWKDDMIRFMKE